MALKSKKPTPLATSAEKEIAEPCAKQMATLSLTPVFTAAGIVQSFSIHGELDYLQLADHLTDQCNSVHQGDLRRAEAMLTAQAHSLDAIFANMARRAALNAGEYMGAADTYLKLALRAQNQCRATLETLAAIKNPPVVFAKQANIAHGPQQVNNGGNVPIAHAKQIDNQPIELLEHDSGKWMDTGTTTATGRSHQAVETVEAIHRPTQRRGQGHRKP